jgi:outer membrane protein assembly factor BamD
MNLKHVIFGSLCLLAITGCSDKSPEVYNKSADYWYSEMVKAIVNDDLEKADEQYTSLSSEHVASPLLGDALIILAQAHMDDEEYADANRYLDEYIKRFGTTAKNEYIRYFKIRANYASFSRPNRNQQLIIDTIADTRRFVSQYPDSPYIPMINSMLVHMELGEYLIGENVAKLYNAQGKTDAAAYYKERDEKLYLNEGEIIRPSIPWYRKWFEW